VLAPGAWADFVTIVGGRAGSDGGALIAVPFWARFAAGAGLAFLAGWLSRAGVGGPFGSLGERRGEVLLVVALTLANPTLWATALSLLVAIVPLLRSAPPLRGLRPSGLGLAPGSAAGSAAAGAGSAAASSAAGSSAAGG